MSVEHISVTQAARHFSDLLNRVYYQGVHVKLERGNKVVAQISPVTTASSLSVKQLNHFFNQLPHLGDDAELFLDDIKQLEAQIPVEKNAWD
jgi:antitoxin (DNA-binding transcriptional repressor) of toxin-antitoxin stability system